MRACSKGMVTLDKAGARLNLGTPPPLEGDGIDDAASTFSCAGANLVRSPGDRR